MHLWLSERLRDSFKLEYLNNLEWNLRRMKSAKSKKNQSSGSSNEDKLLGDDSDRQNCNNKNHFRGCVLAVLSDLLMIFSCCYCCGACID
ncbi:hypothetical protein L1987_35020 [Smallanthus sonchifolius]|uniref:Uncharacterized protein n=1 Tax=Smallanthus sonchifolius TaxID=185202 RepID=A0ACB9HWY1_9ASTR|nr:hypothetical protein L1987_35020 [Smallanthus sonchifolius]